MAYSDAFFITRETWRDWRIEAQQLVRLARVAQGMRVLEIGCGGGGLLRRLEQGGANAVGVDTLPSALSLAKARLLETGHTTSLVQIAGDGALAFRSGAFDVIIGQHVMEHVVDVDAALCEWKRVLRVGGRLAVATPNARYPDPAHFADADHVRVFSPEELRAAMERAGLVVESCFTLFPFLSHLRLLRAFGVLAHRLFQYAPYWYAHGRTIMLCARKAAE
jgi:2-polyprenyl-3-methyl-5-hydroxy-6-metoxy-1,4-benzoquinol methylase